MSTARVMTPVQEQAVLRLDLRWRLLHRLRELENVTIPSLAAQREAAIVEAEQLRKELGL